MDIPWSLSLGSGGPSRPGLVVVLPSPRFPSLELGSLDPFVVGGGSYPQAFAGDFWCCLFGFWFEYLVGLSGRFDWCSGWSRGQCALPHLGRYVLCMAPKSGFFGHRQEGLVAMAGLGESLAGDGICASAHRSGFPVDAPGSCPRQSSLVDSVLRVDRGRRRFVMDFVG